MRHILREWAIPEVARRATGQMSRHRVNTCLLGHFQDLVVYAVTSRAGATEGESNIKGAGVRHTQVINPHLPAAPSQQLGLRWEGQVPRPPLL